MHTVSELVKIAEAQLKEKHIKRLGTYERPVLVISDRYPGVWLEHCYDAIMWVKLHPEDEQLMKDTLRMFIKHQRSDGQLPCYVWDKEIGYCQIQEVVSFARLCLDAYRICGDRELLRECYDASCAWIGSGWITTTGSSA